MCQRLQVSALSCEVLIVLSVATSKRVNCFCVQKGEINKRMNGSEAGSGEHVFASLSVFIQHESLNWACDSFDFCASAFVFNFLISQCVCVSSWYLCMSACVCVCVSTLMTSH